MKVEGWGAVPAVVCSDRCQHSTPHYTFIRHQWESEE